jgi:putative iron-regulated protein
LNGTGPGNGNRPATDYNTKKCSNGNCERRGQYLKTVTDLLVDDLAWMAEQWAEGGEARKVLMDGGGYAKWRTRLSARHARRERRDQPKR